MHNFMGFQVVYVGKRALPQRYLSLDLTRVWSKRKVFLLKQKGLWWCGGQVVSVLAFYSDDLSSNPAEAYNFSVKLLSWKEHKNKQKEAHLKYKKNKPRSCWTDDKTKKAWLFGAVVVAQLVKLLLLITKVRGSNPVIGKLNIIYILSNELIRQKRRSKAKFC